MTLNQTMIAIDFAAPGGPEVLTPVDLPVPRPEQGEVLVRVFAAGVNGPDKAQREGRYPPPPGASRLLGLEISGEVVALGEGVTRWQVGDVLCALTNGGGYAGYAVVPEGQALPVPDGWDPVDAAALPETYFTVQQGLVLRAGLEPGMTVLIHGAAGGIGGAVIGTTLAMDAYPIAVVSTEEKADYVRTLGVTQVIVSGREDFVDRVLEITGKRGADRIVDIAGGAVLAGNIKAAARGGHILQVSTQAGGNSEMPLALFMSKQLTLSGSTLRPQTAAFKARIAASTLDTVWPALASGRVRPPRLVRVPMREAAHAHRLLDDRSHFGKIVLVNE